MARGRKSTPSDDLIDSGFIAELHGVRGIALALVVLFHVFGQGRVSGGVDVFLFFSGFLLTGSMFRRSVAGRPGRVLRHYVRTLLRLVPAAVVVLIAVVIAILALRPLSAQSQDLSEVRASLLYLQNWELIWSQLAYGAAGPGASPLQHFWSLSLQGQFFVLWPWCVVGFVALGNRSGRDPWRLAVLGTGAVTTASFIVAQVMVRSDQPTAYFHSAARWWELTLGGLLALVLMRWTPPPRVRPWLGWMGLAIIVGGGLVVDGGKVFPGPWVLLPLAGAACVLLGAGHPNGPRPLLQTRPLKRLADFAYELYLWHWPILIFLLIVQGRDVVDPRTGVLVVAVSVAAAWLTHLLVSRPFQHARTSRPRRILWSAGAVLALGAVVCTVVAARSDRLVERSLDVSSYTREDYPGAESVLDSSLAQDSYRLPIGPPADVAAKDVEPALTTDCWQTFRDAPEPVEWCDSPQAAGNTTVVLVGSSRAQVWQPAFQELAEDYGWTLRVSGRGSCPLPGSPRQEGCARWNEAVLNELLRTRPDAVVLEGTEVNRRGDEPERVLDPDGKAWRRLADAGIEVFALRAAPRFLESPPECVERLEDGYSSRCDRPADIMFAPSSPFDEIAAQSDLLHELDLVDDYCPHGTCPVVLGNLITARDTRHFTAAFARTLAPAIAAQMRSEVPTLFDPAP